MKINFINSDKKLYRSKIYINKDKYNPTELDMKFLKSFNIPIKVGTDSKDVGIYLEGHNSFNDISYFYNPLFYFIEFQNGHVKLDEERLNSISGLDTSVLELLLFNSVYNKFRISKGLITKYQNILTSCISGLDYETKVFGLLFYVVNEVKTTHFSKLEILYILNKRLEDKK